MFVSKQSDPAKKDKNRCRFACSIAIEKYIQKRSGEDIDTKEHIQLLYH